MKKSVRKNMEGEVIEGACRKHLRGIWELSGKQLGWFGESFGSDLSSQEAQRGTQGAAGGAGFKK